MISNNYYPITYEKFTEVRKPGSYIIMFCVLDDRIHFEMPVENMVFVTQRFKEDIYEEMNRKGGNYMGDQIALFIKSLVQSSTAYRYYPTEEMKEELRKIQLYDRLVVEEKHDYEFDGRKVIEESDNFVKTYNNDELILKARKER